jgi:hypothetical protein
MSKQRRVSVCRGLRRIDSLAGATHLWVSRQLRQQQFVGQPLNPAAEDIAAAGFLAGLAAVNELADEELLLVAYAYALQRDRDRDSVEHAHALRDCMEQLQLSCGT